MIADLHVHTTFSDGSLSPRQIVLEAVKRGLGALALCDHDTTAGAEYARGLGLRTNLAVIPAVEISAWDPTQRRRIHLLGYNYRSPARHIENLCRPVREARHAATLEQIALIASVGYPVDESSVTEAAIGDMTPEELKLWPGVLYKQHIMAVLRTRGATDRIYGELYQTLFKNGGIAVREIEYANVFTALEAIKADGGRAVLAHPGQQDSFDLVAQLASAGLDGIELYHEDHTPEDYPRVLELAQDYRLILTGGSDAHGTLGSIHAVGDIRAPSGAVEALTASGDQEIDWAVSLVRRSREIVLSALVDDRAPDRKGGDNRDLVTKYDTIVEDHLVAAIKARFPDDDILAEERGEHPAHSERAMWIIDPIDGTTNFVTAHRDFAISVARYRDGKPEFGIVYDCMADTLYLGIAGRGAWRDGILLPKRDVVSRPDAIIEISVATVHRLREIADRNQEPSEVATMAHRGQRSFGCASLGLCRVADGTLDIYLSSRISTWDYAAAVIVLGECGGLATVETKPGDEWGSATDTLPIHRERRIVCATSGPGLMRETRDSFFPNRFGLSTLY